MNTTNVRRIIAMAVCLAYLSCVQAKQSVLITTLYNEKNPERIKEFITCFEKNLKHPLIKRIHVLYDGSKDGGKNILLNYLRTKPVTISYIKGRPSYTYCFELANKRYKNERILVSNADIYFNETLRYLDDYDFTNLFIALTRWNVQNDGSLMMFKEPNGTPMDCSQDVWIFTTPFTAIVDDTILLGTPHCDGRLAYQAIEAGLRVINPCRRIQCCHLHHSDIHTYQPISPALFKGALANISWS